MSVALGECIFYGVVFMLLYNVLKDIESEINKIVNNKKPAFFRYKRTLVLLQGHTYNDHINVKCEHKFA